MRNDSHNLIAGSKVPAYARIERALRARIAGGQWGLGAMLPSRHLLASEYKVSLGTVERAISSMIADGTLSASDRRGTFVSSTNADERASIQTRDFDDRNTETDTVLLEEQHWA